MTYVGDVSIGSAEKNAFPGRPAVIRLRMVKLKRREYTLNTAKAAQLPLDKVKVLRKRLYNLIVSAAPGNTSLRGSMHSDDCTLSELKCWTTMLKSKSGFDSSSVPRSGEMGLEADGWVCDLSYCNLGAYANSLDDDLSFIHFAFITFAHACFSATKKYRFHCIILSNLEIMSISPNISISPLLYICEAATKNYARHI